LSPNQPFYFAILPKAKEFYRAKSNKDKRKEARA
jgi:hypothetical protein